MGRIDELVSAEFATWEQRGRGWQVWPQPVRPEPAFAEFTGYRLPQSQIQVDDGRRPGFLASLFDSLERKLNPQPPALERQEIFEPEPVASEEALTTEFVASLPASLDVPEDVLPAFLDSLHVCVEPTGFEILGNPENVSIQFCASGSDATALQRQLSAFLPKLAFSPTQDTLSEAWNSNDGIGFIVDFGLAHEFMLPLKTNQAVDPFVGLVAVLNELQSDEVAVFQVLFQPVENPWPGSVWRSVTDANGKALFVNRLHLITGTKEKVESPLFGVVVRAAAKAESFERAADIIRDMASSLRTFTRHEGNRLIPLSNDEYPFQAHETDLTLRQSRRSGMLLNRDELLGFVHLPSDEVSAPRLRRQRTHTKAAPATLLCPSDLLLGQNHHAGRTTPVRLSAEQRVRHTHIIGASGTGKSTLLFNLIQQDIESGQGLAVLDPHGDLVDQILGVIPPHRTEDVILLDPTDEEYSIGFNILSAHSDLEKNLLASDLVSVFRRLSSSWGDQLNSVLSNAIRAFLESSRGGTLSDLRRFLIDAEFRNEFLQTVADPDVVYYWRKAFPQLGGNKSIGPVLTRLDGLLGPKPIRYMVSQTANRLDFAHILDTGKIFLAKLSKGQIGNENAFLIGSLLVSKFQQLVMSRQRLNVAQRRDFWCYIDEFQNLITPSMAEILTGARKYRFGLILTHHELQQLQRDPDVASAVMSTPCTRIVFRVGDAEAHTLAKGFASFDAKDIQNLETGEAVCRIERSDADFNLSVALPEKPDANLATATRHQVITASRKKYGTPRAAVEEMLRTRAEPRAEPSPAEKPSPLPPKNRIRPSVAPIPEPPPPQTASEVRNVTSEEQQQLVIEATRPVEEPKAEAPKEKSAEAAPKPDNPVVRQPSDPATPQVEVPAIGSTSIVVSPPLTPAEPTSVAPVLPLPQPADLGRGGAQHQAIQKRIKEAGQRLGFHVTIEKPVSAATRSADLALVRDQTSIACEISITSTIDYEVKNVGKCLQEGFGHIAVICVTDRRLEQIQTAVQRSLGQEVSARVGFYLPDQFIGYLEKLLPEGPKAPPAMLKESVVLGYTVRRHVSELTPEERKAKEGATLKTMLADTLHPKQELNPS